MFIYLFIRKFIQDRWGRLSSARQFRNSLVAFLLVIGWFALIKGQTTRAGGWYQQPTVDIPTVTSTPTGPMVTVPADQVYIYVRSGPGPEYPKIGILVTGEKAPARGTSGDYIQIVYLGVPDNIGWVHRSLVILDDTLPQITPPPTPTARVTATLDPTLAARYVVEVPPTGLPTFTKPAPLVFPTYAPVSKTLIGGNIPAGFFIMGLAVVGIFGVFITIMRGR